MKFLSLSSNFAIIALSTTFNVNISSAQQHISTSDYHTSLRRQIDSQQHISNKDIPAATAVGSGSESPEPSWCSSSFEGGPQQIIENSIVLIDVAWLEELRNIGGCGQLPRATWTIEPAADGVNNTQIWMSPPDLGQAIV